MFIVKSREDLQLLDLHTNLQIATDTPQKTNMSGWKIHHLKMYFVLKMEIFQCHVSFQGVLHLLLKCWEVDLRDPLKHLDLVNLRKPVKSECFFGSSDRVGSSRDHIW